MAYHRHHSQHLRPRLLLLAAVHPRGLCASFLCRPHVGPRCVSWRLGRHRCAPRRLARRHRRWRSGRSRSPPSRPPLIRAIIGLLYAVPAAIAGYHRRSDWPGSACPTKVGGRRLPRRRWSHRLPRPSRAWRWLPRPAGPDGALGARLTRRCGRGSASRRGCEPSPSRSSNGLAKMGAVKLGSSS